MNDPVIYVTTEDDVHEYERQYIKDWWSKDSTLQQRKALCFMMEWDLTYGITLAEKAWDELTEKQRKEIDEQVSIGSLDEINIAYYEQEMKVWEPCAEQVHEPERERRA